MVHAAFNALKSRDYNGLASLCDPLSLASFKQEMVDEYCPALSTADDQHTHPPVELSEEEYAELVDVLDPVARMQSEFPTIRSLDQLISMGEVVWAGRGSLGSSDGRVALYLRSDAPRLIRDTDERASPRERGRTRRRGAGNPAPFPFGSTD